MGFLLVYKRRLRARHCVSAFSKTGTSVRTGSHFKVVLIKNLLLLTLLIGGTTAMAQADNRYGRRRGDNSKHTFKRVRQLGEQVGQQPRCLASSRQIDRYRIQYRSSIELRQFERHNFRR